MGCDTTGFTTSASLGIVVSRLDIAGAHNNPKLDECLVSCQSGGSSGWLSLGLHIHISTLYTSSTNVEQFRRKGSTQLGAEPFGVGRFAHLCARILQKTTHAWISRKKFSLGDIATTTPGPVHPLLPVNLFFAPHHGRVTSIDIISRLRPVTCETCCLHSMCRISFAQCSLCCRYQVIGPLIISIRIRKQQLSVNRVVTQQTTRQTQARSKYSLRSGETRPITIAVFRVTTLSDCRFKLPAFNVTLFIHVTQLVFQGLTSLPVLPWLPRTLGVDGHTEAYQKAKC